VIRVFHSRGSFSPHTPSADAGKCGSVSVILAAIGFPEKPVATGMFKSTALPDVWAATHIIPPPDTQTQIASQDTAGDHR
jgi:hypothetical protein